MFLVSATVMSTHAATYYVSSGGKYNGIYGGCKGQTLTGSTNVVLGGNANAGESISDSDSKASKCYVYGGGSSGAVTGITNVTLQDKKSITIIR